MKNNTNTILDAIRCFSGIAGEKISDVLFTLREGMYEVSFRTDYLSYDCFVDAETHEVIGFDCEPIPSTYPAQAA